MRETIIGVFGVIVLIVSVLSFFLMRATLGDVSNRGEATRAVNAAVAQLQVEGLRIERWLNRELAASEADDVFGAGSPEARSDKATTLANTLEQSAKQGKDPAFSTVSPSIIVVFDDKGLVLGRNASKLMRGEKLGQRHPEMLDTILRGATGSGVWVSKPHNEQWLASYAPIRNDEGKVIGGVAVGTPFNNERLQQTSEATSKLPLFAVTIAGDQAEMVATSQGFIDAMKALVTAAPRAVGSNQAVELDGLGESWESAAKALGGYGDGRQAVILAATEMKTVGSFGDLLWPALGVLVLGLILTGVGAHLLDNYISQPISDLEDGLLAVINGQTDLRFELEHKVLGGLVFRVNSLLNQLLGVREDDTDEQGRPSVAPSSQSFEAALNVDERMVSLSIQDVADARTLRDEAPEDYYKRIFDEYVDAKRALGDPVDHIKFAPFSQRIRSHEHQLGNKHGKPFRFQIEAKGKEVVFVAVPLS